ncbi:hypothetical protein PFISCL1PPCAC_22098, partial [Pristionchus fissidentatus]
THSLSVLRSPVAVSRSCSCCRVETTSHWRSIRQGNYATSAQLLYIAMTEIRLFYEKTFPAITELSEEEQEHLFKSYFPKFGIIDNLYRTRKLWGEIKRFIMGSVESAMDTDHPELWLEEGLGGENRNALIRCMNEQYQAQFEVVVPAMTRAMITNKEFHAMIALVLCEIDSSIELSDRALSVIDGIRIAALEDLQRYYKDEMGMDDFSSRLGNVITLNHAIQECISINVKFSRIQTSVFDIYAAEEKIHQLFI